MEAQSINIKGSAIKSVTVYTAAGPVECCDRCSQGIRYVNLVRYADGTSERYGSECINKILDGDTSLARLFEKNVKLLRKYQEYLSIFEGPVNNFQRGHEYFNSGLYAIADSKGKDITFNRHWFFHPQVDLERNRAGGRYVVRDEAEHAEKALSAIHADIPKLTQEIARIEVFLARILRSANRTVKASA